MMINRATKEMTIKIVFYGPGLCGKTTNLEYIYEKAVPEKKGKLLTVATETDRTLFFDFLPMELGQIRGMKLRVQLYTVPGQVFYDATRRIVLRGSDGVVFVADSQAAMMEANIESLNNLKKNLQLNSLDPDTIPLVLQYNKQDLSGLATEEELENRLNWREVPHFLAVATVGKGVNETLRKIIELVVRRVHAQEEQLKQAQKQMAPSEAQSAEAQPPEAPAPPPPTPAAPVPEPEPAAEAETAPGTETAELPAEVAGEPVPLPQGEPETLPVEVEPPEAAEELPGPSQEAVPVEPELPVEADLDILAESLDELEKRATALSRDLAEVKGVLARLRETLGK